MLTRLGVLLLPLILTSGLARSEEPALGDEPLLSFRIRLVNVPAETYEKVREAFALDDKKPLLFGEEQLATFLEMVQGDKGANILMAPQVKTLPNQSARMSCGSYQSVVIPSRVTPVNGVPVEAPEATKVFVGLTVNMTPRLAGGADAKAVELDLNAISNRLRPTEPGCEPEKSLQKGEVVTNTLDRKLHLSFGKTVVLPGWWEVAKSGEKPSRVVVCVTAEGK